MHCCIDLKMAENVRNFLFRFLLFYFCFSSCLVLSCFYCYCHCSVLALVALGTAVNDFVEFYSTTCDSKICVLVMNSEG